jgi:hypothetical protein
MDLAQALFQEVAKEVVQAQRQFLAVEYRAEQPPAPDLIQPSSRPRVAADLLATCDREFGQQRTAQQKLLQFARQLFEDFAGQVFEQVAAVVPDASRRRGRRSFRRSKAQAEPGGPALGPLVQAPGLLLVFSARGMAPQILHFLHREAQRGYVELGHFAPSSPASQRQRGLHARGNHQCPVRRQAFEQLIQELEDAGIGDGMQVIPHEHAAARHIGGFESVEQR